MSAGEGFRVRQEGRFVLLKLGKGKGEGTGRFRGRSQGLKRFMMSPESLLMWQGHLLRVPGGRSRGYT